MRTGTMGGKGSPGAGGGVNARPRLRTYKEGVIGKPMTSNKTPSSSPKASKNSGRTSST